MPWRRFMQLSQLLNMTTPISPIQGKTGEGDSQNGENGLFDSLLEMYFSPDGLENPTDLIEGNSEIISDEFINEIKDELKSNSRIWDWGGRAG